MNLSSIAEEITVCTRCDLHKSRQRAVPGEGSGKAKIMPGRNRSWRYCLGEDLKRLGSVNATRE
jgi:hypothetical protein